MNQQQFIDEVNGLSRITESEKRIAAYFIEHFMALPYARINDLCREIGVGKATLGRFLENLGFNGFMDFKKALAEDMALVNQSPLQRFNEKSISLPENYNVNKDEDLLQIDRHFDAVEQLLKQTMKAVDKQALQKAIDCLSNPKGKLYVIGSATAYSLALYFTLLGRYLKKDIILLDADISTLPHRLANANEDDVLLAISYYRFSSVTVRLVRWFYQQRGSTVVITDRETNPFSTCASALLVVQSQSTGLFNSRSSGFVLLEALVNYMAVKLGNELEDKFKPMEELFDELDVFCK